MAAFEEFVYVRLARGIHRSTNLPGTMPRSSGLHQSRTAHRQPRINGLSTTNARPTKFAPVFRRFTRVSIPSCCCAISALRRNGSPRLPMRRQLHMPPRRRSRSLSSIDRRQSPPHRARPHVTFVSTRPRSRPPTPLYRPPRPQKAGQRVQQLRPASPPSDRPLQPGSARNEGPNIEAHRFGLTMRQPFDDHQRQQ